MCPTKNILPRLIEPTLSRSQEIRCSKSLFSKVPRYLVFCTSYSVIKPTQPKTYAYLLAHKLASIKPGALTAAAACCAGVLQSGVLLEPLQLRLSWYYVQGMGSGRVLGEHVFVYRHTAGEPRPGLQAPPRRCRGLGERSSGRFGR